MTKLKVRARHWAWVAAATALVVGCGGDDEVDPNMLAREASLARTDRMAPTLNITSPTDATVHATSSASISLQGTADDNKKVARVTWMTTDSNGVAGLSSQGTSVTWDAQIDLKEGENAVTVRAYDADGNRASKRLYIVYTRAPATSVTTEGAWTRTADEGQAFSVSSQKRVRFGLGSAWVERSVAGSGECSVSFFGTDPMVGTKKVCEAFSTMADLTMAGAPPQQLHRGPSLHPRAARPIALPDLRLWHPRRVLQAPQHLHAPAPRPLAPPLQPPSPRPST